MRKVRWTRGGTALVVSAALSGAAMQGLARTPAQPATPGAGQAQILTPAADLSLYTTQVAPIFAANCNRCHAGLNHRGGLSMQTREGLLKGGHDGAVIVPGHPEQSLLVKLIRHEGPANDPMPMPPRGKLTDADIATVSRWIAGGALMPAVSPPQ